MTSGHDSPLLGETMDALEPLGELPDRVTTHVDRGYDSEATRQRLKDRGLTGRDLRRASQPRWQQRSGGWLLRLRVGTFSCYRAESFPMALVSCARLHTGSENASSRRSSE